MFQALEKSGWIACLKAGHMWLKVSIGLYAVSAETATQILIFKTTSST